MLNYIDNDPIHFFLLIVQRTIKFKSIYFKKYNKLVISKIVAEYIQKQYVLNNIQF